MSKGFTRFLSVCLVFCLAAAVFTPLPAFAGAVEPLNVEDYGAVGDGVTDDRAAIQAAIDAAAAGAGGGIVIFPAGTYLVEEILVLKSNITLLLDDDATILNGMNYSSGPSIVFMTGSFIRGGAKVFWEDTENITIIGGTIDMNGKLNEDGSAAENLPNVGSSGAFALGYCDNVRIEGVTFLNSYKGHAIQICACDGVSISNCAFKGQSLPNILTASQKLNLEMVQIEPSTTAGFPYASNATGEPSQNVTIENCYFGASAECGEPVVGIGTHNQISSSRKCNHINILNNEFDNMMYAGIRFCGYEDVTIRGNTFTKKTEAESVNYRADGCVMVNAYCYNNTTEELDLNRRITIDSNVFRIADPATRGIRVAKDQETYLGTVTDISITNNTIINTSAGSSLMGIQAMRVSDNLTVTGNTITGGYRGIEVQYCTGNITINGNQISNQDYQYFRFLSCGDNQNIYFYTHGGGTFNVSTANHAYTVTAVPNVGYSFAGFYKQNALQDLVSTASTLVFSINQSANVYRHASFAACSHTYKTAVTAPTCTEQGYTTYTCSLCGYSYDGSYVAASGHAFGSWTTIAAGCTTAGSKIRACSKCGEKETQTIAATGHDYELVTHPATCKEYEIYRFSCSNCGDSYQLGADEMTAVWLDTLPNGMDESLFETKTQYRYSDYEIVTSYEPTLPGYTLKGSTWEQTDSGTVSYVSGWPAGFDTGSSLYAQYDNTGKTASETTTAKTIISSDQVAGYLYYHWCAGTYTAGPINRSTSAVKTDEYSAFHGFYSTTDPSTLTAASDGDGSYTLPNANCCTDSHWYYCVPVRVQTYAVYKALFFHHRWTEYTEWSDTAVTGSSTRRVETRTVYRYRNAELAGHSYENGSCTVCGAADPNAKFGIYGSNMVLGNVLNMNFFIEKTALSGTDYYAVITHYGLDGTTTTTVPYDQWQNRLNYMVVTLKGLAAKQMTDKIEVVIYHSDGTQASELWTDSVRDYGMRILEKESTSEESRTMIVDMLNYGAAAQNHFGYKTDDLANNRITAEQQNYATQTVNCTNQLVPGEKYYGSSLVLEDQIKMKVYFKNITRDMYAVVTFEDHLGVAHEIRVEGSEFYEYNSTTYGVIIDELVVADGNQMITVNVFDSDGNQVAGAVDSMNSYLARMMETKPLYEMVAKFIASAYAKFH